MHGDRNKGEIVVYRSDDGRIKLDVRLQDETVWLTQPLMAELFHTTQQNISRHIQNIYEEDELESVATHKKFLSVRREGNRQVQRNLDFYNLDMIISVGYRGREIFAMAADYEPTWDETTKFFGNIQNKLPGKFPQKRISGRHESR